MVIENVNCWFKSLFGFFSRKIALLHIDSLSREFDAVCLLKSTLEMSGVKVVLSSRLTTYHLCKLVTPDVVVLTHTFSLPNALKRDLQRRGCKVFLNVVEEVLRDETYMKILYRDDVEPERFDGIFLWSFWAKNWLLKNTRVHPSRVHAFGSIRNSLIRFTERYKIKHRKIGFLGRFEGINTWDRRHPFVDLAEMDPEILDVDSRYYFDKKLVDSECFCLAVKAIRELIFAGFEVVLRPHPNEDLSSYQFLKSRFGSNLTIDDGTSLINFLGSVKCVCGPVSSAFTEAYLLGVPIISFDGMQKFRYHDREIYEPLEFLSKGTHQPKSVNELVNICSQKEIKQVVSKDLSKYLKEFYSLEDQHDEVTAVAKHLLDSIKNKQGAGLATYFAAIIIRAIIDLLRIVQAVTVRRNSFPLRSLRRYHFNSILHRKI